MSTNIKDAARMDEINDSIVAVKLIIKNLERKVKWLEELKNYEGRNLGRENKSDRHSESD